MTSTFTVGRAAEEAQVNIETIRFYERKGLLPKPPRSTSGYRQYSPETVARIHFIKRSQELGFSLREIAELLSLRVEPEVGCGDVRKRAEEKILEIEAKIRELRRMKEALTRLADRCRDQEPTGQCPILEYLELEKERP